MTIKRAQKMRNALTNGEKRLWVELRELKKLGLHVRRQAPIGPYIADFAILKERIVIEVDGSLHQEASQMAHDEKRDAWLKSQGFKILRFKTGEIDQYLDGCVEEIMREAGKL